MRTPTPHTGKATAPSLLSADITIRGDLEARGEVQIDGTIDGNVNCGKLVVGEQAIINGGIQAEAVLVRGKVVGKIEANQVELMRTAKVQGDVVHETMSIEAGAFLEGMCRRMDSAKSPFDDATLSATAKTKAKKTKAAKSVDESGGEEEQAAATAYSSRRKLQPASFGDSTKRASSNSG